ncbi:MAG: hypothetical protein E7583_09960 [Ruminococcaceae bacterium]|nr:hypothetical protein [Oscillospiraceae bacterium]
MKGYEMKTRIMTSNIWGDYFGNPVEERAQNFINIFSRYSPDVIGIQEATTHWYKSELFDWLTNNYYLAGSEYFADGTANKIKINGEYFDSTNYTVLAYKKGKYELYEKGMERYFNTPDPSKVVTWAVLRDVETDKVFGVCDTHLWWKYRNEDDHKLRAANARQMVNVMKHLSQKYGCPVFAMGDFNSLPDCEAYTLLRDEGVLDLQEVSEVTTDISSYSGDPQRGDDGKLHGKPTTEDKSCSIDHIVAYGEGYIPKTYAIVTDQDALDSSDHSPVYADIELV